MQPKYKIFKLNTKVDEDDDDFSTLYIFNKKSKENKIKRKLLKQK